MEKLNKPIDRQRRCKFFEYYSLNHLARPSLLLYTALSASDLLDNTLKSQFESAASTNNSFSSAFSDDQLDGERADKLFPIPPRRTQKMKRRSKSSSAVTSLEQDESRLSTTKLPGGVVKRPLAGQLSNPELGGKVKLPRPPPPNRQIPPRTFTLLDSKTRVVGKNTKLESHGPVVLDTRAKRRPKLSTQTSQPERPPLPYETFVLQKQSSNSISKRESACQIDSAAGILKAPPRENQIRVTVTPPPVYTATDYEVAVPQNLKFSILNKISALKSSCPLREDERAAGGAHRYEDNLANGRNRYEECQVSEYEVPNSSSTRRDIVADERQVEGLATVPSVCAKPHQLHYTDNCDTNSHGTVL